MKVLVLGGTGLLGEALMQQSQALGHVAVAASRGSHSMPLDIADRTRLAEAVAEAKPELVINCAALASIDACEADPVKAFAVNAEPVRDLARLSQSSRFKLVHVSTDHYFTGGRKSRHNEDAPVTLLNEYARSKFASEKHALAAPGALVVRTAFVGRHSGHDRGFAEHAYDALQGGKRLTLFEDAYTSLLHRADVAQIILELAARDAHGIVNVASSDVFSKADLIRAFAHALGLTLNAQSGSVKTLKVPRAESLGLDPAKLEALLGRAMPGLDHTVRLLAADFRRDV
jgi:dTDP-4-dehydrorhamnose reductase